MFKVLSIPVWTAVLFHVVTIFGPFRVPVICTLITVITVSVVTGFIESRNADAVAAAEGKNACVKCMFVLCLCNLLLSSLIKLFLNLKFQIFKI